MFQKNHNCTPQNNDFNQSIVETQNINQSSTKMNDVSLNNSSHIQMGTRVIYNGPVMISNSIQNSETNKIYKCGCCDISQKTLKRILNLFAMVFVVLLSTFVVLAFFLRNTHDNKSEILKPEIKLKTPSNSEIYRFYTREDWNASKAEPYFKLIHPIKRVIISHTVMRECYVEKECIWIVQEIQRLHKNWDFGDIGFNFVIMNDGSIFEGRGWDIMGAHTRGFNNNSIGIVYNGNFQTQSPPQKQILAGFSLLEEGVRLGKLSPDFKIYGMRQFQSNESPGEAFFQMIKTWKNWSEDIDECCPKPT
ncbi:hypothetical protein PVAND_010467 [Polypedilum vanderplanki]|uniref:Peptidoglycan recognition protein n=1 Tax=Polypedilum vanderplanki TaxID=319348 RepID=A0A9J6CFM2_POLVA|nr:hypothetical protein PVAND_010467 [Polypedilum vanderplanki]